MTNLGADSELKNPCAISNSFPEEWVFSIMYTEKVLGEQLYLLSQNSTIARLSSSYCEFLWKQGFRTFQHKKKKLKMVQMSICSSRCKSATVEWIYAFPERSHICTLLYSENDLRPLHRFKNLFLCCSVTAIFYAAESKVEI